MFSIAKGWQSADPFCFWLTPPPP
ncbi:transcriptional regulator PadR-like family protein, partial [Vibrio parahaemolyticus IDH02640]